MFYPESSHPANMDFPDEKDLSEKQHRHSFYQNLLNYFIGIWGAENFPPVVKTPDIYAFRLLIK
ncbi:MAG: hypothetical protein J0I20_23260 [Chloroflexi bacterium]|nr:hypothetical protein [Chloroflexota bacterium]OJV92156.1 MAG: hypothetical protein BGO39_09575 [Chloroflexi bacterium 54-19]